VHGRTQDWYGQYLTGHKYILFNILSDMGKTPDGAWLSEKERLIVLAEERMHVLRCLDVSTVSTVDVFQMTRINNA